MVTSSSRRKLKILVVKDCVRTIFYSTQSLLILLSLLQNGHAEDEQQKEQITPTTTVTTRNNNSTVVNSQNISHILKQLLAGYDNMVLPGTSDQPTLIRVGIYVENMIPIEAINMHYSMEIYLRTYWKDDRLAYGDLIPEEFHKELQSIALDAAFLGKIWTPDLYFPLVKKGDKGRLTRENALLRLKPDGEVFCSQRLHLTVFCEMDMANMPFDHQECPFPIGSFTYNDKYVALDFVEGGNPIIPPEFPNMLEFTFDSLIYKKISQEFGTGLAFDELHVIFHFSRLINYYLLQIYLPCLLIVFLSWVGFWIDHRSTPARVALGITTVLTMITFTTSIRSSLPFVNYTRLIDVYLLVCFVYVFMALVEFAIVGITDQTWKKKFENLASNVLGKRKGEKNTKRSLSSQPSIIESVIEEEDYESDVFESGQVTPRSIGELTPRMMGHLTPRSFDSIDTGEISPSSSSYNGFELRDINDSNNNSFRKHLQPSPRDLENGDAFSRCKSNNKSTNRQVFPRVNLNNENSNGHTHLSHVNSNNGISNGHTDLSRVHLNNENRNGHSEFSPVNSNNENSNEHTEFSRVNSNNGISNGQAFSWSNNAQTTNSVRKRRRQRKKHLIRRTKRKVSKTLFERQKKNRETHIIDRISRVLYPTVFFIFNVIYFVYGYTRRMAASHDDH